MLLIRLIIAMYGANRRPFIAALYLLILIGIIGIVKAVITIITIK